MAQRFISAMAQRLNEPPKSLHPLTQLRLQEYSWPGNIRELHNRIEHACLVSPNPVLVPSDIFSSDWQRTASQLTSRSEEHTSELQSLMRISYAVFCLKKKKKK